MDEQVMKAYKCCTSEEFEQCKECPLREFGHTQLDCKTELLRKINPKKVWEVTVSWANGGGSFINTDIYSTEEKARKSFNFEIDKDGNLDNNEWTLETSENCWELYETGYYNQNNCVITLIEKEIL